MEVFDTKEVLILTALPVTGFVLSEVWNAWKAHRAKRADGIDESIEANTKAVVGLTMALTEAKAELKAELGVLRERTDAIPRIKDDLTALHGKVREHAGILKIVGQK